MIGVMLCAYFSFHALYGKRSYNTLAQLTNIYDVQDTHIFALKEERKNLEKKVEMMRSATMSKDMLEEQVRDILGYHHQNELIIFENQSL